MEKMNIFDLYKDDKPVIISQEQFVAWCKNPLEKHNGLDTVKPKFTPLFSPCAGLITRASYHFSSDKYAFGNRISILFDDNLELYLAHLDGIDPNIFAGLVIPKGIFLGRVGSTGASTGDHTHIGIRKQAEVDGQIVWLSVREFLSFEEQDTKGVIGA